jgi:hypothetical protein
MLHTKLKSAPIFWILVFAAWNILPLAESNKLENVKRVYITVDLFSHIFLMVAVHC